MTASYIRFRILSAMSAQKNVFHILQDGVVQVENFLDVEQAIRKISVAHPLTSFDVLELEFSAAYAYYTFAADPHDPDQELKPSKPVYVPKR
jgi:hypothetical protein